MPLMTRLVSQQMLVGFTIFTGGVGAEVLTHHGHFGDLSTWAWGALGALGPLALGHAVETSPSRDVVEINAATNKLVLRLLGPKQQPIFALAICIGLGALVGIVEETLFRGQLMPQLLATASQSGLSATDAKGVAVAASALLFALAHVNVLGGPREIASRETGVTVAMMTANGAWFGFLSLLTGQLGAAIVAHALYDAITLYTTHVSLTAQIESATARALASLSEPVLVRWKATRGLEFAHQGALLFHLLDTDKDGSVGLQELRLAGATHGLSAAAVSELESEADQQQRNDGRASGGRSGLEMNQFLAVIAKISDQIKRDASDATS
jgi:membrane protease YdiL (CAAX protease family)